MKKHLPALLVLAIILSEIMLNFNEKIGFAFYVVLISGVLLPLSKIEKLDDYTKLIIVLMILPIIRISELFIAFNLFFRSLIFYFILFFLVTFYIIKFKVNPGFKKKGLILLPLAILLAISLGFFSQNFIEINKNLGVIFLIPIIVYGEEVLFRGLMQRYMKKTNGAFSSVLLVSLIYGVFSLSYGFPIAMFLFVVSIILGVVYNYTENLFLTITMSFIIHLFYLI